MRKALLALLLIAVLLLSFGCKKGPNEKTVYSGIRNILEETIKFGDISETYKQDAAVECDCISSCLVALKQETRHEDTSRMFSFVAWAVVDGMVGSLRLTRTAQKVVEAAVKAAKEATTSRGFKGEFTRALHEERGGYVFNKTCEVVWFGLLVMSENEEDGGKMTIFARGTCGGKKCAFEMTYRTSKNGYPRAGETPTVRPLDLRAD